MSYTPLEDVTSELEDLNEEQDAQTVLLTFIRQSIDKNNELIELMKINNIQLSLITGEDIKDSNKI